MTTLHIDAQSPEFSRLRASLKGEALLPTDAAYEQASFTWNGKTFPQQPALIILPEHATDVQHAVRFARTQGLPIAVQAGGHAHPIAANGAMLINFSRMRNVQLDREQAIARIEGGALWRDVLQQVTPHGLAPLSGFAPTVGVLGYLLGGGVGWLARKYGFGAGSIRSFEVVTVEGELLHVDRDHHADLFWALRGASGAFAIVTSVEIALYPVKEVFGGKVIYPGELASEVMARYFAWTKDLPDSVTSSFQIMNFPETPLLPPHLSGKTLVRILAAHTGDQAEGAALIQPMRELGTPISDSFGPLPFSQIASIAEDPEEPAPVLAHGLGGGITEISEEAINQFVTGLANPKNEIFLFEIRHFGDALSRHAEEELPVALRKSTHYMGALVADPTREGLRTKIEKMSSVLAQVEAFQTGEALTNLMARMTPQESTLAAYSPAVYERLRQVKKQYDPEELLRFTFNIPPAE